MPDVAYKDLCLDTTAPDVVGPFWRDLLGLTGNLQENGDWALSCDVKQKAVWVNTVPEPKLVKSRVHLDVRVEGPPPGTLVTELERWSVMADPDGLEWCAFAPREGTGPFELVVDSSDPRAIAQWWADRTGATVHTQDDAEFVWLTDVAGFPYSYWVFNPVPEPKTVKNRMHWDVSLVDGTVETLVSAGAQVLEVLPTWTVLADPEGNEFCAFG